MGRRESDVYFSRAANPERRTKFVKASAAAAASPSSKQISSPSSFRSHLRFLNAPNLLHPTFKLNRKCIFKGWPSNAERFTPSCILADRKSRKDVSIYGVEAFEDEEEAETNLEQMLGIFPLLES